MVAAFVVFELFAQFFFFDGQDYGEGESLVGDEIVVAGLGVEGLGGFGELFGGEDLDGLGGGGFAGEGGGAEVFCEGEGGCSGEGGGAEEVAARWILGHVEVEHIFWGSAKTWCVDAS